jgi:GAF domain-containing protein
VIRMGALCVHSAHGCYPLEAFDGRLLGTFAAASATRESFTDDEVALLGTLANFLAQAWELFDAQQALRKIVSSLPWRFQDFPKHETP